VYTVIGGLDRKFLVGAFTLLLPALLYVRFYIWLVHVGRFEIRQWGVLYLHFPFGICAANYLLAGGSMTFPWLNATGEEARNISAWKQLHIPGITRDYWHVGGDGDLLAIHQAARLSAERSAEDAAKFHKLLFGFLTLRFIRPMVAWDFEMTMLPDWESADLCHAAFCQQFRMSGIFCGLDLCLETAGGNKLLRPIEPYVYNYIAQMMFAFTCCGSILFLRST